MSCRRAMAKHVFGSAMAAQSVVLNATARTITLGTEINNSCNALTAHCAPVVLVGMWHSLTLSLSHSLSLSVVPVALKIYEI